MEYKNKHSHSPSELQQNLRDIEEELKKPVDHAAFKRLFGQLQIAQEDCSEIKSRSHSASYFLSDSEDRICSLFGKVMNTHVESEINNIVDLSLKLKEKDAKGALALQKKINSLRKWHRPSKENLLKLANAEEKIQLATGSSTKQFLTDREPEELSEEVENLFKLASLVYNKNQESRNKTYLTLSFDAKERFNKHLICLKTKAFEKEKSTIQALFASAFELAGVKRTKYFSSKEIRDFFAEEKKALESENNLS